MQWKITNPSHSNVKAKLKAASDGRSATVELTALKGIATSITAKFQITVTNQMSKEVGSKDVTINVTGYEGDADTTENEASY